MNSLIRLGALDILLIQETKLEDSTFLQASRKIWKKYGAHATSVCGASGGLGSLWNPNKFSLISESLNTHWILLKLQHLESKETICLVMYMLLTVQARKIMLGFHQKFGRSRNLGEHNHCWRPKPHPPLVRKKRRQYC